MRENLQRSKIKRDEHSKGITLVALVITIIILIILAGVSINLVLGENGMFTMAQRAKQETEDAMDKEERDLKRLEELISGEAPQVVDKTPGELSGEGTESKPYLIESIEDLVAFSNKVNAGDNYDGKNVKLTISLDFQSEKSYIDAQRKDFKDINGNSIEEGLKTELTTGTGFKPIGNSSHKFNGIFDGDNCTISNLYLNTTGDNVGLFGYIDSESNIKNLLLTNANINVNGLNIGSLVGYSNGGKIENIKTTKGKVIGTQYVGGIVGRLSNNGNIYHCVNQNEVQANGKLNTNDNLYHCEVGGIVGRCENATVQNSMNLGNIKATQGICLGGIVGQAITNSLIDSCNNKGEVGELINGNVGGIVGDFQSNAKISRCFNSNTITGDGYVGGIAGIFGHKSQVSIENCYNTGSITANSNYGGICGITSSCIGGVIKNCYNIGTVAVSSNNRVGGIAGNQTSENVVEISNCYYLSGTCEGGINQEDIEGKAEEKDENTMTSSAFVDTLNKGNDETVWKQDTQKINKGYPILITK